MSQNRQVKSKSNDGIALHRSQSRPFKINYKEYSQKGFIDKINPQFIGIAKTVQNYKKERKKIQQEKLMVDHQVSYMEKINQKLENSLKKRKNELKYVRSIKNRYLDEIKKKQRLEQQRERNLRIQKLQNQQFKQLAQMKRERAIKLLTLQRRAATIQVKNELSSLKSQDYLKKSRQYDLKRSRVELIEQQKHKMSENYKQFFKSRNQKFINDYRTTALKESRASSRYKSQIKTLQERLIELKDVTDRKRQKLQKLNETINSVKRQKSSCSIRSRNYISTRSKSPSVFLTSQIFERDQRKLSQGPMM